MCVGLAAVGAVGSLLGSVTAAGGAIFSSVQGRDSLTQQRRGQRQQRIATEQAMAKQNEQSRQPSQRNRGFADRNIASRQAASKGGTLLTSGLPSYGNLSGNGKTLLG